MRILAFITALMVSASAFAEDLLPVANRANWTEAGVPGGIPYRTTVFASLTASATAAQIQAQIDACPSNQVVFLASGTYSLNNGLRINRDGVTLRGATNSAGEPTTILVFASTLSGGNVWGLIDISKSTYPTWSVTSRNVNTTLDSGTTTATLSAAPTGLTVGQLLVFDRVADDNLVYDNGTEGGGTWGRAGSQPARTYMQFVRVTAINSADVTFEPSIYGSSTYWSSPQAYYWSTGIGNIVVRSGLEDLAIVRSSGGDGTHNIAIGPADSCWVRNIRSRQCDDAHIRASFVLNTEIRDSIMGVHDDVGSATYSIWAAFASGIRIENNGLTNTPCAIGLMSVSGSVIAYNVAFQFPYSSSTWLPECMMTHGGHCYKNIFEGNHVPSIWIDWIHGNSSYTAVVRNRLPGWETGKTASTRPINFEEQQDYGVVIGNIFGTESYHDNYNISGNTKILNIDSDAAATMTLKENYNTVDDGINATEAGSGGTVSVSYLYASKPAYFGNKAFPPFNYQSASSSLVDQSYTNLPIGHYMVFGTGLAAEQGVDGGRANGIKRLRLKR